MNSPFDRTRRWLAQFAANPDALARALSTTRVILRMSHATPDNEIALAIAATLLLRLDHAAPIIELDVPTTRTRRLPRLGPGPLGDELAAEHHGFASTERLSTTPTGDAAITLAFGDASAPHSVPVASGGWQVAVGLSLAGPPGNEIAAAYAGVLAATEAIKAMLRAVGIEHRTLQPWVGAASLWDYSLPGGRGPALPDPLDLDGHVFLGCGGIGSATAWATALLNLTGSPVAIDDDELDLTSLNRHLTASHTEARAALPKANALAALLNTAGAQATPIKARWQQLDRNDRSSRALVAVSVDDDTTRRDLQLDFPRIILNAGNSDAGLYRVTRHDFINGACLRCISRADLRSTGPEASAARRIGLSLDDIRPYLLRNDPLPEELLDRASISAAEHDQLTGVRARQALGIVCATFAPVPELPALSMPPLAAAPGVLLAGEIAKATLSNRRALGHAGNIVTAGILHGPHARWLSTRLKQPECECSDPIYRRAYRRAWPDAA
jgi:hypothetical protein